MRGGVPAGAEDVIVAVDGDGKAYEVAFLDPVHVLATVELSQIA